MEYSNFVNAMEISGGLFSDEEIAKNYSLSKLNCHGAIAELLRSDLDEMRSHLESNPEIPTKTATALALKYNDREVLANLFHAVRISVSQLIRFDYRFNTFHPYFKLVLVELYECALYFYRTLLTWNSCKDDLVINVQTWQVIIGSAMGEIIRQQSFCLLGNG